MTRGELRAAAPARATLADVLFGCALFAGAFALRLFVARTFAAEPVWDGHYYDFGAKRIADGFGYSDDGPSGTAPFWHPWCHYPVGYSAYLAVFYKLFGATRGVGIAVNALTGALLAPLTWLLSRHAMATGRARIAGVLVALHPGLVLYSALVMAEQLAAALTLLAFLFAVRDSKALRGAIAGAAILGVATLVRPQSLLCAPFLAFVVFRKWPGIGRALLFAIGLSAIALLPVLPWTARNCKVMDGCTLVSTNGGWNLAIGAFPRATGRFETLRSSDGCREVTGQVQQDRCWFEYGLGEIRAHPIHFLELVPKKLAFTFDHESFAVGYLHEARPEDWSPDRMTKVRGAMTLALELVIGFAFLGCVAYPEPREKKRNGARAQLVLFAAWLAGCFLLLSMDETHAWPLTVAVSILPFLPLRGAPSFPAPLKLGAALIGTTALTHAIFFGEDRYHIVTIPVFCMFLAGALRKSANDGAAPSNAAAGPATK